MEVVVVTETDEAIFQNDVGFKEVEVGPVVTLVSDEDICLKEEVVREIILDGGQFYSDVNEQSNIWNISDCTNSLENEFYKDSISRRKRHKLSSSDTSDCISSPEEDAVPYKRPKKRNFAHRLQWKNKDMLESMKAVLEKKMSLRAAARKFHVPYSSLKDRINGRVQHGTKPGVKTVLSPEEEQDLVQYIHDMESSGFHLRNIDVRQRAGEILQLHQGGNAPFKDCSPGHNWLAGFFKRHSGVNFKKAVARSQLPSIQKQKKLLEKFYQTLISTCQKGNVLDKPKQIFVITDFNISSVLDASLIISSDVKGNFLHPFVFFPGCKLKLNSLNEAYHEAFFTCSKESNINHFVFYCWLKENFIKQIAEFSYESVVLIVCRPCNDISIQFLELCKSEKIFLVCLPLSVAHLLQPIGPSVLSDIEQSIYEKCEKWEIKNLNCSITLRGLAEVLRDVWHNELIETSLKCNFTSTGIYPINKNAITVEQITQATALLKEVFNGSNPFYKLNNRKKRFIGLDMITSISFDNFIKLENILESSDTSNDYKTYNNNLIQDNDLNNDKLFSKSLLHDDDVLSNNEFYQLSLSQQPFQILQDSNDDLELSSKESTPCKIYAELVASRTNADQIDSAVKSIIYGSESEIILQEVDEEQIFEDALNESSVISDFVNAHEAIIIEPEIILKGDSINEEVISDSIKENKNLKDTDSSIDQNCSDICHSDILQDYNNHFDNMEIVCKENIENFHSYSINCTAEDFSSSVNVDISESNKNRNSCSRLFYENLLPNSNPHEDPAYYEETSNQLSHFNEFSMESSNDASLNENYVNIDLKTDKYFKSNLDIPHEPTNIKQIRIIRSNSIPSLTCSESSNIKKIIRIFNKSTHDLTNEQIEKIIKSQLENESCLNL